jgi:beta-glucosidase
MKNKTILPALLLVFGAQVYSQKKWVEIPKGSYTIVQNRGGQALGYSPNSGVKIIQDSGLAFKDLNKNGVLDNYEDWRKPVAERAKDLASKMSLEQIAGLMLYSRHQSIPAQEVGMFTGTYNGKPFSKSGAKSTDLSDQQIAFLTKDNLRHVQ